MNPVKTPFNSKGVGSKKSMGWLAIIPWIFFAATLFGFIHIQETIIKAHTVSSSWVKVEGKLVSSERIKTKGGGKSASVSYWSATYTYEYQERQWESSRVEFGNSKTSFSSVRLAEQARLLEATPFVIWIDPNNPQEAVIDPTPNVQLMAFMSVFLVFPGFLGWAYVIFSLSAYGAKLLQTVGGLSEEEANKSLHLASITLALVYSILPLQGLLLYGTSQTWGTGIVNIGVLLLVWGVYFFSPKLKPIPKS